MRRCARCVSWTRRIVRRDRERRRWCECVEVHRSSSRGCRDHVDAFAATVEFNDALGESKQSIVSATADVPARQIAGAALTDDDAARLNYLAAVYLDAQPLAVRITPVAAGALTFL